MPTSTNVTNLKINELTEAQYDAAVQGGVIGANELSVLTDAQIDPLPSQTGNAGKFLTTDGTDASWSDKPLVNQADELSSSVIIKSGGAHILSGYNNTVLRSSFAVAATSTNVVSISSNHNSNSDTPGNYSVEILGNAKGVRSLAIGPGTKATGKDAVVINTNNSSTGDYSIAIGANCATSADRAIQIGSSATLQTNSDANTFKVANGNGNFEIMSADGTIPTARLTKVNSTITLTAAGWSSNTQTVTVNGVTSTSVVLVAPDPSDTADYVSAGILCTSQATNSLTFTATTTPTTDIDVNIVCL